MLCWLMWSDYVHIQAYDKICNSQLVYQLFKAFIFNNCLFSFSDLYGWPLLTPLKVQMQKCDKCSQEFCSTVNYRRHIRMHRRLNVDKVFLNFWMNCQYIHDCYCIIVFEILTIWILNFYLAKKMYGVKMCGYITICNYANIVNMFS